MTRDLISILVLAALATINPSLLAAVTVMLLAPRPRRLMLGYLLGAYTTTLVVGVSVVFVLHDRGIVRTSRHTVGPGADIFLGAIALLISFALATHRDAPLRGWRAGRRARKRKKTRDEPWHLRMLASGSAGMSFLAGAILSFPGASYLSALHDIVKLDPGAVPALLLVIFFCVMQQGLIELPLFGYVIAPEWTPGAVARFRAGLRRRGRQGAVVGLAVIGILLLIRGGASLVG